jgi:hypothetical protein
VLREVLDQLVDAHSIDAGTSLVLLHPLQRLLEVASLDDSFHQAVVS